MFDFFTLAVILWLVITLTLVVGVAGAAMSVCAWRSAEAKKLYLGQCDAALAYPQFGAPDDEPDLRAHTFAGKKEAFEQYEWYVARLVYVLDECIKLGPRSRWLKVARTQLGAHKKYFASEYYAKQDYLPHYSPRMQRLIREQRS